jgi:DNA repair protein RadC
MQPSNPHSLQSWPEKERPRERLLQQGSGALSDAELVAIVLRNGRKGQDVMTLSRQLIERFGGLRGLGAASAADLQKIKGLGPAKITSLIALGEIARRQLKENILGKDVIRDPESVVVYLKRVLQDQKIEIFKVLFLNKANAVLAEADLSVGTIDEAHVHPREVVKKALEYHATSLILVHNHPSGRTEPSAEDLHITRKIQTACESVSVKILDHIIIGGDSYYSFREHGRLS